LRLLRDEQVIVTPRPRWFVYAFGFWLAWVILHLQQEIVFQIMTGGKVVLMNDMTDFQDALYRYQFMIMPQVLIFGGLAVAITLFLHERISRGKASLSAVKARQLFNIALVVVVFLGALRFALYAADRKYSVIEAGKSLTRVFSEGVLLAGDCSSIIALQTDFKTLPSYGDLIRHKEKELFEEYPITHFMLRFPTLFEYLDDNYPGFEDVAVPVRIFSLCGREATIVRYVEWPGYASAGYTPSLFERGVELLHIDEVEGARDLFNQFLTGHPDSYEAVWGIALCEYRDGNLDDAKTLIERALEMTDRDELSYEAYADILDALGERLRAAEYLRKALELSPNSRRLARKYRAVMGFKYD
jgi:tetratricopeptide (TPR) repeat protein